MRRILIGLFIGMIGCFASVSVAQPMEGERAPASQAAGKKLPHVQVDVKAKQIRVDCEMLGVEVPLEFFCVLNGTNEHESVLRTAAKPSDIHLCLLMLGLEPGEPVKYSEAAKKWFPPHGPPLDISAEFVKNGRTIHVPAGRMMRSIKDKTPMPAHPFIFAGSQLAPDGTYAADITGYVVSIVNFDLSMIDVPELASNANETLEWQIDKDFCPPPGTAVTMIIEPSDKSAAPTTRASAMTGGELVEQPGQIAVDQQRIAKLRKQWQDAVEPHQNELRDAARSHYEILDQLRREQQRLIDQADQLQRLIDELDKRYRDLTTPQPPSSEKPADNR